MLSPKFTVTLSGEYVHIYGDIHPDYEPAFTAEGKEAYIPDWYIINRIYRQPTTKMVGQCGSLEQAISMVEQALADKEQALADFINDDSKRVNDEEPFHLQQIHIRYRDDKRDELALYADVIFGKVNWRYPVSSNVSHHA